MEPELIFQRPLFNFNTFVRRGSVGIFDVACVRFQKPALFLLFITGQVSSVTFKNKTCDAFQRPNSTCRKAQHPQKGRCFFGLTSGRYPFIYSDSQGILLQVVHHSLPARCTTKCPLEVKENLKAKARCKRFSAKPSEHNIFPKL